MSVPTWAGFVAYLPDDEVATDYEIAVYGGREMATAMGEIFAGLGCSHVSEPDYGGEVGWDFHFRYCDRHSFWCRVQSFHPIYWLLLEGPSGKREMAAHAELWRKFADALDQDPRFDQIRWRAFKEGPPDWDEFILTDDLPPRAILEELPHIPTTPRRKAVGGPFAPVIIGAWCGLVVVTLALIEKIAPTAKTLPGFAFATLLVGLVIALRMIDWRRERKPGSSRENLDPSP
jgi:hypothetical protein